MSSTRSKLPPTNLLSFIFCSPDTVPLERDTLTDSSIQDPRNQSLRDADGRDFRRTDQRIARFGQDIAKL
ncbi:hypothetical protein [Burkholderia cenocepacia]|uniref:hypothetical protein n=1 Tax=Burkholderia cenocepacia TaxID=95486 RepID=UPI001B9CA7FC|nr:hypothetical protein [Burkholderia cenocepacia]MBR7945632.1 hypothetical protein [Burkholderia cenocepacia]